MPQVGHHRLICLKNSHACLFLVKVQWTFGIAIAISPNVLFPFIFYRYTVKIPKISPSMYKPLQIQAIHTRNAKNPPINRPSKYKPPGGALCLEIVLKYKVKQSKKCKSPSNYKASPIDFETQNSLHR